MRKKNAFINVTASMGRGLLYAYLYIMFRPKICYQSRKAKEEIEKGGVIFIGNHVGHNDGQMFYMLFKNSVLIIAKDWADKKILKWLTSGGKFISVDRFGTDITWIRGASEHLRAGDNMIIFPEGHTSKTGVMDEFKPGFAMLAVMSGAKIVPVYNERGNMLRLETALSAFLKKSKVKSCILFVNDGSQDGSGDLIREICRRNKDFFYIGLAKNCGLSAAMKAGIDYTCSRLVGYIDADLQTTPEDFNLLLEYTDDYELVMGIRVGRKDSLVKNMSSKVANGFRRLMTKDGVKDTGCPLKILHTEYAQRIPFFTGMHRFLPALILLQQGKVKQVPVRHYPRIAEKSKYNLYNRLISPFKDCFAYRWMKKRYINYEIADTHL